tara:strand:- start:809 stop:1225 length:417 start_codon:yes stop_codon:yes gene_type:complete
MILEDTLLWIVVLTAFAGLGTAFAVPSTRPYARKYWWVALALGISALAYVLLRRRPGNIIDSQVKEGQDIGDRNLEVIDNLVDAAFEQSEWADAELARKQLQTQEAVFRMEVELTTVKKIDDSFERRKALIKVVENYS